MEIIDQYHEITAVFLARIFLGFLFFFQGYDAVFNIKIANVITTYKSIFLKKEFPNCLIIFGSWFTSYTALVGGAFLILGIFEYFILCLLGINIILASISFGINTAMWDTRFIFPRLLLILFLLLVPQGWNYWSLDNLLFK